MKRGKKKSKINQLAPNSRPTRACKNKDKNKDKNNKDSKNINRNFFVCQENPEKEPAEFLIKVSGKKKRFFLFDQKNQTPQLKEDGFEPIDIKIVQYLIDRILENDERVYVVNNLTTKNLKTWLQESRRLRLINEAPLKEIGDVMKWCQDDNFWKSNILSMTKFRQQYDILRLQMKRDRPTHQDKYGPGLKAFKELMNNEKE